MDLRARVTRASLAVLLAIALVFSAFQASENVPLALPKNLPSGSLDVPILMYERVADASAKGSETAVASDDFEKQLDWLATQGYTTITQQDLYAALVKGEPLPDKPILLAFSEGSAELMRTVLPQLRQRDMSATAYVAPSQLMGNQPESLTSADLRVLAAAGFDIGSMLTPEVDLPTMTDAEVRDELLESRRMLEQELGQPVQWMAYPEGQSDTRIEEIARDAGYVLAVTPESGNTQERDEPLALRTIEVTPETNIAKALTEPPPATVTEPPPPPPAVVVPDPQPEPPAPDPPAPDPPAPDPLIVTGTTTAP